MNLNEKLLLLRKTSKKTQLEVAEKLNVSQSAVSAFESGRKTPSFETTKKIIDIYHVTINYLIWNEHRWGLPEYLTDFRLKANLSREELAEKSNTFAEEILLMETGILGLPDAEHINSVGKALGIDDFYGFLKDKDALYARATGFDRNEDYFEEYDALTLINEEMKKEADATVVLKEMSNLYTVLYGLKETYYKDRLLTPTEVSKIRRIVDIILEEE